MPLYFEEVAPDPKAKKERDAKQQRPAILVERKGPPPAPMHLESQVIPTLIRKVGGGHPGLAGHNPAAAGCEGEESAGTGGVRCARSQKHFRAPSTLAVACMLSCPNTDLQHGNEAALLPLHSQVGDWKTGRISQAMCEAYLDRHTLVFDRELLTKVRSRGARVLGLALLG